jgi:KipI family sensor histidine kinase inhibitor
MTPRLLPCGPTALLAEVDTPGAALHLAEWLRSAGLEGVVDLVPTARTVLVQCSRPRDLAGVVHALSAYSPSESVLAAGPLISIPTVYDGLDLAEVAESTSMTVGEVIECHSAVTYVGAFTGFTPGFTYLTGLDPALHLPRRPTPRARVPAGSLAMGADLCGIYPTASPGGWHLLGHTDVVLWDPAREQPALIPPGSRVRFVPVDDA